TNIDLPAASPAQVQSVIAVGSRSGLHPGRLSAQPAGNGTAFTPDRPFSPGERVTVTATFRSAKAGTASGADGTKQISFSFSIERAATTATGQKPKAKAGRPHAARSSPPLTYSLVTHPGYHPPIVTMSGKDTDTTSGDTFLDVQNSGQPAGLALNPAGSLLWYRPAATHTAIHNVRVQSYQGHPVLTFWQGASVDPPGGGRGEDLILNNHYQTIHTVTAGNGYKNQGTDLHEFALGHKGSEGVAFVTIWSPAQANLTSIGGPPNGQVYDWIIQEIDVATDKVIWEWHALGHVPVKDSYLPYVVGQRYDFFHMDSIQQLSDGNILVSSRDTWAVYLINKKTGKIIWRLGGKHSSFKMGVHTNFEWQHDATLQKGGVLTLFDDANNPKEESQSRALTLHLSTKKRRATLLHQYRHSPPTLASSQGSTQILPNRNVFVGWGSKPFFSEYSARGKQLFGGSFVAPVASYRAYRFNWVGIPLQAPVIAVRPTTTAGEDSVYASWNGSTQVRKWQVLSSSSSAGPFAPVGSPVLWSGFETKIHVAKANYFKVEALNSSGTVLATSNAVAGR
ncbi:MAG TPA: arylsulfotransferase family protein, partial [Solirubrobacteraceae bacterium]|nr:arylsulfotransferase family protein [Solirubrobacteraceae bacterium]